METVKILCVFFFFFFSWLNRKYARRLLLVKWKHSLIKPWNTAFDSTSMWTKVLQHCSEAKKKAKYIFVGANKRQQNANQESSRSNGGLFFFFLILMCFSSIASLKLTVYLPTLLLSSTDCSSKKCSVYSISRSCPKTVSRKGSCLLFMPGLQIWRSKKDTS